MKDCVVQDILSDDSVKCTNRLIFSKEKVGGYGVNYTIQYDEKYYRDSTTTRKAPLITPAEETNDIDPFSINIWKQVTTRVEADLEKNRLQMKRLFTEFFTREGLPVPKGRVTMQVTILNDGSLLRITFRFGDNYVMSPETGIKLFEEFDNSGFFIPWEEKKIKELFFAIPMVIDNDR